VRVSAEGLVVSVRGGGVCVEERREAPPHLRMIKRGKFVGNATDKKRVLFRPFTSPRRVSITSRNPLDVVRHAKIKGFYEI
jgi:hypothetical protein